MSRPRLGFPPERPTLPADPEFRWDDDLAPLGPSPSACEICGEPCRESENPHRAHEFQTPEHRRRLGHVARIETLRGIPGSLEKLVRRWPAGIPTFKQTDHHNAGQLDQIDAAIAAIEAEFEAPFGPVDEAHTT